MSEDLRAELAAMEDEADWEMLGSHARAGRVVFVHAGLNLIDVGTAIARDDRPRVENWLAEGLLRKPSDAEIEERSLLTLRYRAIIVRPFVLVQEQPLAEP